MVWILSILGLVVVLCLAGAMAWGIREMYRSTTAIRLERALNPGDVLEINQAFARVQRDVLYGD
jgi:hypothetical protein